MMWQEKRTCTQSADTCQVCLIAEHTGVALVQPVVPRLCQQWTAAVPYAVLQSRWFCQLLRVFTVVRMSQNALRLNTDCILCVFQTALWNDKLLPSMQHFWLISVFCSNHTFCCFFLVLISFSPSTCSPAFSAPPCISSSRPWGMNTGLFIGQALCVGSYHDYHHRLVGDAIMRVLY